MTAAERAQVLREVLAGWRSPQRFIDFDSWLRSEIAKSDQPEPAPTAAEPQTHHDQNATQRVGMLELEVADLKQQVAESKHVGELLRISRRQDFFDNRLNTVEDTCLRHNGQVERIIELVAGDIPSNLWAASPNRRRRWLATGEV